MTGNTWSPLLDYLIYEYSSLHTQKITTFSNQVLLTLTKDGTRLVAVNINERVHPLHMSGATSLLSHTNDAKHNIEKQEVVQDLHLGSAGLIPVSPASQ